MQTTVAPVAMDQFITLHASFIQLKDWCWYDKW